MTFRLRAMTAADVPAVAALHVATFNETHTVHNDGPSLALRESQWSKAFAENDGSWFGVVIEAEDGELVGFAKGKPHDGGIPAYAGELNKIYLLRRLHRRSLGKRLRGHGRRANHWRDAGGLSRCIRLARPGQPGDRMRGA